MAVPDRLKSWPEADASKTVPPKSSVSTGEIDEVRPADAPDTFDEWLDSRLKGLYKTVLSEPLPPEIYELLEKPKKAR